MEGWVNRDRFNPTIWKLISKNVIIISVNVKYNDIVL